jgi:hypothetical protein
MTGRLLALKILPVVMVKINLRLARLRRIR